MSKPRTLNPVPTPTSATPDTGATTPAEGAGSPSKIDPFKVKRSSSPELPPSPLLTIGLPTFSTESIAIEGLQSMSFADYQRDPAVNRSALDKIALSPAHFRHYMDHGQEETTALLQGRLLHALLLEPYSVATQFAVFTGAVRRGNAWETFQKENAGKDIVTMAELETAVAQRDALLKNPLVRGALSESMREASAFWTDDETGVACKARFDVVCPRDGGTVGGIAYEIKTTHDISTESFTRDAFKYGYYRQAAWYLYGLNAATGRNYPDFGFIVVEKSAPYGVRVFRLSNEAIDRGYEENMANLRLYKSCQETGQWPGFPPVIETLELPRWAR